MKHYPLLLSACLLAACGTASVPDQSSDPFSNPLYAETYYNDLVLDMMDIAIRNDPQLKDPAFKEAVDTARRRANEAADMLSERIEERGRTGLFYSPDADITGTALVMDGKLHFGPDFMGKPGPRLHVYYSTVVDPRDAKPFPDESAVDLGPLKSPYQAQTYVLPASASGAVYRTVALWDTQLKKLYGFAQLSD